jgi:hypothetical protein
MGDRWSTTKWRQRSRISKGLGGWMISQLQYDSNHHKDRSRTSMTGFELYWGWMVECKASWMEAG